MWIKTTAMAPQKTMQNNNPKITGQLGFTGSPASQVGHRDIKFSGNSEHIYYVETCIGRNNKSLDQPYKIYISRQFLSKPKDSSAIWMLNWSTISLILLLFSAVILPSSAAYCQPEPSPPLPRYGLCTGSSESAVFASDVFEVSTNKNLADLNGAWQAYLARVYQASGSCQAITTRSKVQAYSRLDQAVGAARQAPNAQGQIQNRRVVHTGWRGGS